MRNERRIHFARPTSTPPEKEEIVQLPRTCRGPINAHLNSDTHPVSSVITFRFPARRSLPPVKVTWYEGLRPPRPAELEDGRTLPKEGGALFKGTKGTIMCGVYGESPRLIPEVAMQAYVRPAPSLPRIVGGMNGHEQDWVRAAKAGRQPGAHFGYSGPLTETCLLGNIAKRMDTRLEWDAAKFAVTNLPEANQYIRATCRPGWSLVA